MEGCSIWGLPREEYGRKVEQGLGKAPGFGVLKNGNGCRDGCIGIGPGGTGTGIGNEYVGGPITTEGSILVQGNITLSLC